VNTTRERVTERDRSSDRDRDTQRGGERERAHQEWELYSITRGWGRGLLEEKEEGGRKHHGE
jgi:hypothetical protein